MLRRVLASSRYVVLIAVLGSFVASVTLLVYEGVVVVEAVVRIIAKGQISAEGAKILAVGLIQAVDIFLIAIAAYIISLGSMPSSSTTRCACRAGSSSTTSKTSRPTW